jgi:hypothetical protein
MAKPVQPAILDFEGEKNAAGLQYAKDFGKGALLRFLRAKMVQNEDSDGRRKHFLWKRQRGSVALHNRAIVCMAALRDAKRKRMAILKTRHSRSATSQLIRGRARAGADFENVVAQFRIAQKPWQYLLPRHVAPEGRSAKPVLEAIHSGATDLAGTEEYPAFLGLGVLTFLNEQFVLRD